MATLNLAVNSNLAIFAMNLLQRSLFLCVNSNPCCLQRGLELPSKKRDRCKRFAIQYPSNEKVFEGRTKAKCLYVFFSIFRTHVLIQFSAPLSVVFFKKNCVLKVLSTHTAIYSEMTSKQCTEQPIRTNHKVPIVIKFP